MSDFYFGGDVFSELDRVQRQVSSLFGNLPSSIRSSRADAFPRLNIGSTDDAIHVVAQGTRSYAKERFAGGFRRVIELPQNADTDKVEARYENGTLSITIGKREASKPRAINIQ